jgi:acyl carrier protein
MELPQIYDKLTGIFQDLFDDDSLQVTPELTAKDVDGWDSVSHIRMILTVEKAFKMKFSTTEVGRLKTVGDMVQLIRART